MATNLTVHDSNESYSNSPNVTFARNEDLARVEVIVQSVIFVLAVLGNTTVLMSLYRKRKSLTRMHHLMMHLSLADLFVAFGSVLPQLAWDITYVFMGGDILCRLVKYMQIVAIYASAYVLVMTAVDRYFAICLPFISHKWSNKMVRKMVIVAWMLSLILSVPQLFIFSYKINAYGMYDCWGTFDPEWTLTVYITTFTVLVYIIPACILVFCYGSICFAVWRSSRNAEKLGAARPSRLLSRENVSHNDFDNSFVLRPRCDSSGYTSSNKQVCNEHSKHSKSCENGVNENQFGTSCSLHRNGQPHEPTHDNNKVNYTSNGGSPRTVLCKCSENGLQCHISGNTLNTLSVINGNGQRGNGGGRSPLQSLANTPRKMLIHSSKGSPSKVLERRGTSQHGISRAKMRTIKLTLAVVICYLACWSPFFIAQMWAVYDPTAPFYGAPYTIILLLASLNSCTNPWIYLLFSESFLSEVRQASLILAQTVRCQQP